MDNAEAYGDTFELLTFKKAIEAEPPILSDYQVLLLGVSEAEIANLIEQNAFVKPDEERWDEVEAETLATVAALRKAMKRHRIRHAVSFHSSIKRARRFALYNDAFTSSLPEYGSLDTFHVSSKVSTGERVRELREFEKSRRALITNARCLTEGVDVPDIDCVLFADPRRSTVDIVQATGRALRLAKGKKKGYVVVPVLVADGQDSEAFVNGTAFGEVMTILRALASNDERITEYFQTVSQRPRSHSGIVSIDVDEVLAEKINLEQFAEAIQLRVWEKLARLSWRPFQEAREHVRSLKLASSSEWRSWCQGELPGKKKRSPDIPAAPERVYADQGWKSWGDWLGTGRRHEGAWRDFKSARRFSHSLKLKSWSEWSAWCKGELEGKPKRPTDIPASPSKVYLHMGWIGMGDWLGTGRLHSRDWRDFESARRWVQRLKLRAYSEWKAWCRGELPGKPEKPANIPGQPAGVYSDRGWKGWGDWLGTGVIAPQNRKWREFESARRFARELGLRGQADWSAWCRGQITGKPKRPLDMPSHPDRAYRNQGWESLGDWLGTGKRRRGTGWRDFESARRFVRSLRLKGEREWRLWVKGGLPGKRNRPQDIPTNPYKVYSDQGFEGWADWLGTTRRKRS
ncbi:MAG: hypothetical protein IH936_14570 [Acidobacteria bacterium]|nr:hypothetical protein [Acidobacteriota bacterium]